MTREMTSKKDIYKAVGYTLTLVALSYPIALLGMKVLNVVLGSIKL